MILSRAVKKYSSRILKSFGNPRAETVSQNSNKLNVEISVRSISIIFNGILVFKVLLDILVFAFITSKGSAHQILEFVSVKCTVCLYRWVTSINQSTRINKTGKRPDGGCTSAKAKQKYGITGIITPCQEMIEMQDIVTKSETKCTR